MAQHSVIYSHRDENGDALRVECWPETVEVDAEDANGEERVFVSLPREEGIKMARSILAALDAEPEQGLTVSALEALLPGTTVIDRHGDEWVKQSDGVWQFYSMKRGPRLLVDTYGPITAKDGVGSSRHADKTETGDTP